MKQNGQVIIILLLIMLVALSFGLALTQRSVTDVTTSTQAEQSTRAFSAAEAGIQKALASTPPLGYVLPLDNNSSATVNSSGLLPYSGSGAANNVAIEYPKIGRETTAQFWLVDPSSAATPPTPFYNSTQATSRLELYYGNESTTDYPAVEVRIVMFANGGFHTYTRYYDSSNTRTSGANDNNFGLTSGCGVRTLATGILGTNRRFFCQQIIPDALIDGGVTDIPKLGGGSGACTVANGCTLILARVRFIYTNENHSIALAPVGASNNFPPQVQIYNATGVSGQSQKQIQAFKVKDVVLPWFDFAIFSTNEIRK